MSDLTRAHARTIPNAPRSAAAKPAISALTGTTTKSRSGALRTWRPSSRGSHEQAASPGPRPNDTHEGHRQQRPTHPENDVKLRRVEDHDRRSRRRRRGTDRGGGFRSRTGRRVRGSRRGSHTAGRVIRPDAIRRPRSRRQEDHSGAGQQRRTYAGQPLKRYHRRTSPLGAIHGPGAANTRATRCQAALMPDAWATAAATSGAFSKHQTESHGPRRPSRAESMAQ